MSESATERVQDAVAERKGKISPVRRWELHLVILNAAPELLAEIERLRTERDHLQKFKDYVHKRLDAAGVPVDPESSHKAEGCRIGGRLDEVFAVRDALLAALVEAESMLLVAMRRDLVFTDEVQAEIIASHPGMKQIRSAIANATEGK